jgi:hypothetical protein
MPNQFGKEILNGGFFRRGARRANRTNKSLGVSLGMIHAPFKADCGLRFRIFGTILHDSSALRGFLFAVRPG